MDEKQADILERAKGRGSHGRQQEEGVIVIGTVAMPADTTLAGDIFGGWLMSQMDLAAGNMAGRVSNGRGATVAVEGMQFLRPVKGVSYLLCMSNLAHASPTKEHDDNDDFQRITGRAA